MSKVLHVTNENFETEVNKSSKPVLVDFWAEWCGPCKMIAPVLDEMSVEREDLKIVKIDVDKNQDLARQFGIRSIPALYLISGGEVVATKMGAASKAALSGWVDSNI